MAFTKFDSFLTSLATGGTHNLSTADLKVYLSNAAPDAALHSVKADIAELATGNGYNGAVSVTITSRGIVANEYVIEPSGPIVFTGSGTGFGPVQYAVLYDESAANDELIGWWDYPTQITLVDVDETLTLNLSAANGLLKLI